MAIKSLQIGRKKSRSVIYRLWKGSQKPSTGKGSGRDLKTKFRFKGGSDAIDIMFHQSYGSLEPDSINIYLPYSSPDEVFDLWNIHYDQKKGLIKKCDGENIVQERIDGKPSFLSACNKPCLRTDDHDFCEDCSPSGRFYFFIKELCEAGLGFSSVGMMQISVT